MQPERKVVEGHALHLVMGCGTGVVGYCECGWASGILRDADHAREIHTLIHLETAQPRLFAVK